MCLIVYIVFLSFDFCLVFICLLTLVIMSFFVFFFFFKQKTAYEMRISDWSSDVCSSDLIVLRLPLAPGCLPTLWRRHGHFQDAYLSQHPGYYTTGDAGLVDADGFVHVMSRVDDIINVAGHRLSTGAIEQIVAAHPAVAECAVIGANDDLKGMVPVGLVVLKSGSGAAHDEIARERSEEHTSELQPLMRT